MSVRIGFIPYLIENGQLLALTEVPEGAFERILRWYQERFDAEYREMISEKYTNIQIESVQGDENQIVISFQYNPNYQWADENEQESDIKADLVDIDDDGNYPIGFRNQYGERTFLVTGSDIAFLDGNNEVVRFFD